MLATLLPAATPGQLGAADRIARILRAYRHASVSNPRLNGLATTPPTITDSGATLPAATTLAYPYAVGAPGVWKVSGGVPVSVAGTPHPYAAVIATTGGTVGLNDGKNTTFWRASAMVSARYLAVRLVATTSPYRVLVDGRYVSTAGTATATTTGTVPQYLLLDFGSRAVRRVTIEGQLAGGFAGGYVEGSGRIWPVDTSDAVHIGFLGDSYVAGAAATAMGDGVAPVMGDWMGAYMHASGSGGTGWATPTNYRFDERIANGDLALGGATPDIVCLMASINDRARDPATVQTNALAGLRSARVQYRTTPILVFGCLPGSTGPSTGSPSVIAAEQAVQAAVVQAADAMTAFIPVSTDASGAWVNGVGKVGATTGTGNADWAVVSDGIHLGDEGCAMIGRRYAEAAIRALKTLYAVSG